MGKFYQNEGGGSGKGKIWERRRKMKKQSQGQNRENGLTAICKLGGEIELEVAEFLLRKGW